MKKKFKLGETMDADLLAQFKAWGPLVKTEQTKMPVSPLHINEVEAKSAAATRYYRELAALAAEAEAGQAEGVHAGLKSQMKSKGKAPAAGLPKRALPSDRAAVREADTVVEWRAAKSAAPGRVSESQLAALLGQRRDDPLADPAALAAAFDLPASAVQGLFAHLAAPHLAFDHQTEMDFGTWAPRVSNWELVNPEVAPPTAARKKRGGRHQNRASAFDV